MILNHLLEVYALYYFCITAHECGHALAAKMFRLKVVKFQIGDDLYAIRIGRMSFSLNALFGSGVVYYSRDMFDLSRTKRCIFFLAGSAANVVCIFGGLLLRRHYILFGDILIWASLYSITLALFPFVPWKNDYKLLKESFAINNEAVSKKASGEIANLK